MKASFFLSSSSLSSFSTNGHLFMMILIVLLVFVTSSASIAVPEASPTISHHQPPRGEVLQLHPCDALTRENSRSLCIHLHRVYQHRLPVHVLPPLLTHNEIDPRYGVEKRLVPSGPNPLHN
ncbi:CLAVATA3/ESR (CLE)-related protein 10-like [Benincasa hispida]|uniref:CLAVATA3/ESR (CLE)-related protein 10-like n=1 Tax=Benincasa hispida TaxID=102211 RepID=UPI0019013365|nr:CLAVATA3/ESR (CLE)-related protein 10-like [Benincasa hispida]